MTRKTLDTLNYGLLGLIALLVVLALLFQFLKAGEVPVSEEKRARRPLQQNRFALQENAYDAIDEDFLSLVSTPPTMQIPDLSTELNYYGPHGRPDLGNGFPVLQFGLTRSRDNASIPSGDKLYLRYDKDSTPPGYIFSPNNDETSLWIEAEPKEGEALVHIRITGPDGSIISEPHSNAEITLKEKPFTRVGGRGQWQIGTFRVDGTLLARQQAKWFGEDIFLQRHGGEEYADLAHKFRIDFGTDDNAYSIFLAQGDVAVWEEGKWKAEEPGPETRGKPLLQLNSVDNRLLKFDLWDDTGKNKVSLNLLKGREPWVPSRLERDFNFISSRTRTQYVFEVQNKRVTLRLFDWLIQVNGGWRKLTTEQEIDDFVNRQLSGLLFIFDGVVETEGGSILQGTLFNKSRTEMHTFELTEEGKESTASLPRAAQPHPPEGTPPAISPLGDPMILDGLEIDDLDSLRQLRFREPHR